MKILEVYGDEDFAAVSFEEALEAGLVSLEELWDEAAKDGEAHTFETEEYYFEYEAHEFGPIDMDFIDYIKSDFIDYDSAKHHNFYVVGEEKKREPAELII